MRMRGGDPCGRPLAGVCSRLWDQTSKEACMLPCGRPLDCPLTPIPQQPRLSSSLVKVHQVNPSSRKVSLRLRLLHHRLRYYIWLSAHLLKLRQPHRCRESLLFCRNFSLATYNLATFIEQDGCDDNQACQAIYPP